MHRQFKFGSSQVRRRAPVQQRKDTKFIGRLCTGDSTAWLQLVNHWSPRLYSYVIYNTESEIAARKVIHAILSEVVQTILSSPCSGNLTILIFSIAYRHVLYYCRQHPTPTPPKLRRSVDATAADSDPGTNFLAGFRQFSPETQQILLLRYLCGVTLPELAQVVGQSEERLARTLHAASDYL